jgi:hypothetical protein
VPMLPPCPDTVRAPPLTRKRLGYRTPEKGCAAGEARAQTLHTALDNAMAESIMSTLKRELIKRDTWRTRLDLELALVTHIGWYNARRRHRSLKTTKHGRTRRQAPLQVLERYTQEVARETVAPKS